MFDISNPNVVVVAIVIVRLVVVICITSSIISGSIQGTTQSVSQYKLYVDRFPSLQALRFPISGSSTVA